MGDADHMTTDCPLCGARVDGAHECQEHEDTFGEWDGDQVDAVAEDVREVFCHHREALGSSPSRGSGMTPGSSVDRARGGGAFFPTPAAASSASVPPAAGVGFFLTTAR